MLVGIKNRLYKKKKTQGRGWFVRFSLARTNLLTSALLRLLTWRISALDLRLTARLS